MRTPLVLATISILAACGSSDSTAPPEIDPLVGQYVLQTVGGKTMPTVVWQYATVTHEVTAGTLSLEREGIFSLSYTYKAMDNGAPLSTSVISFTGSWVRNGTATVTFRNVNYPGGTPQLVGIQTNTGVIVSGAVFTDQWSVLGSDFFFSKSN
jgi:hypothetical protein